MKLIKGATEIEKSLKLLFARGVKLDKDVHVVGVSVLAHASEHGDTTLADKLVLSLPKGSRKLALVEWMLAFGQLAKLDKVADKEAIANGRLFKLDRTRTLNLEEAADTPWTEFKPEAAVIDAFDVQAAVQSVMKRLTGAAAKGMTVKNREQALKDAQALVLALS